MQFLFFRHGKIPAYSEYGMRFSDNLKQNPLYTQMTAEEMEDPQSLFHDYLTEKELRYEERLLEDQFNELSTDLEDLLLSTENETDEMRLLKKKMNDLWQQIDAIEEKSRNKKSKMQEAFDFIILDRIKKEPTSDFDLLEAFADLYYAQNNEMMWILHQHEVNPLLQAKVKSEMIHFLSSDELAVQKLAKFLGVKKGFLMINPILTSLIDLKSIVKRGLLLDREKRWKLLNANKEWIPAFAIEFALHPALYAEDIARYLQLEDTQNSYKENENFAQFITTLEIHKKELSQEQIKIILRSQDPSFQDYFNFLNRFFSGKPLDALIHHELVTKDIIKDILTAESKQEGFPNYLIDESLSNIFYSASVIDFGQDFLDPNKKIGEAFYREFQRRLLLLKPDPSQDVDPFQNRHFGSPFAKNRIGAWAFYQVVEAKPKLALAHYFDFMIEDLFPEIFGIKKDVLNHLEGNQSSYESYDHLFYEKKSDYRLIFNFEFNHDVKHAIEMLLKRGLLLYRSPKLKEAFENYAISMCPYARATSYQRNLVLSFADPASVAFARASYENILFMHTEQVDTINQLSLFQQNEDFRKYAKKYVQWLWEHPSELIDHLQNDRMIRGLWEQVSFTHLLSETQLYSQNHFLSFLLDHPDFFAFNDINDLHQNKLGSIKIRENFTNAWIHIFNPDAKGLALAFTHQEAFMKSFMLPPLLEADEIRKIKTELHRFQLNYDPKFRETLQAIQLRCNQGLHPKMSSN